MKKVILSLVLLVPLSLNCFGVTFNQDTIYSRWLMNSRLGNFHNKGNTRGFTFTSPYGVSQATVDSWDYVPGLVCKAAFCAVNAYIDNPSWEVNYAPFRTSILSWTDNMAGSSHISSSNQSNIDDKNAAKIFCEAYALTNDDKYKTAVLPFIQSLEGTSLPHSKIESPNTGAGGFWHKPGYQNQMWLDGQYMGPALWAEYLGKCSPETNNTASWASIALQFDIIYEQLYDSDKKLFYHAFASESAESSKVSGWLADGTHHSKEYWGRGTGWLFAALVDVLEFMPSGIDVQGGEDSKTRLTRYLNVVAAGLKARQDATSGCWPQLLQYAVGYTPEGGSKSNYLEASCSFMFTYAYLKGIRLGLLSKSTYEATAVKAFKGCVATFLTTGSNGELNVIQSCESAGLDASRLGTARYYLNDGDGGTDTKINNNSEGKALGPAIMASAEYERAYYVKRAAPSNASCNCLKAASVDK